MWSIPRGRGFAAGHGARLRTLVIGAGAAGRALARDLRTSDGYGLEPVAFLDDDIRATAVQGLPVLGPLSCLAASVARHDIGAVVVAIPSLPPNRLRELAAAAASAGVPIRVLPSFLAAVERDARGSDLRALRIDALLGRDERHLRRAALRSPVSGKRVLITGAGGSIGSEICRQVRAFEPEAMCLLDHDETNLHTLQLELDGEALLDTDELVIGDIRDRRRITQVFDSFKPDLVLHAAAHKHLPLLERHPCEGVKTNVLGTQILADAAIRAGTERFVLISTDKAADPTSVLGATKRLAEMVVQSRAGHGTSFASVRFGNVLGSRGSFLYALAEQVRRGEPVTVTHPDVTRFFMTVEEAVSLVLAAVGMADFGDTFVLDMGEPVRIVDLVEKYVEQMHVSDFSIRYTGLRPGEKLNECLFSTMEDRTRTAHEKVWAVRARPVRECFADELVALYAAADSNDPPLVRDHLATMVPEYHASVTIPGQRGEAALALSVPYPDGF